jgi:predicted kinase
MKPSNLQMPPPEPPILELLVGSIASGKSTWTRKRANQGWLTVNNDSLVCSMHGGEYAWNLQIPGLVELLAKQIVTAAASASRSVIVDNTNRNRQQRAAIVRHGREMGMQVKIVLFPRESADVHAERRFRSDPRGCTYGYWLEVAQKIETEWEDPGTDEADEITRLPNDWMPAMELQTNPTP